MSEFEDEDFLDEFETIIMTEEETGDEIEFAVIDSLEEGGVRYLLVVESQLIDDEDSEAIILKETGEEGDELTYEIVEDDEEFDKIAGYFQDHGEEYEIRMDD